MLDPLFRRCCSSDRYFWRTRYQWLVTLGLVRPVGCPVLTELRASYLCLVYWYGTISWIYHDPPHNIHHHFQFYFGFFFFLVASLHLGYVFTSNFVHAQIPSVSEQNLDHCVFHKVNLTFMKSVFSFTGLTVTPF
jgi:hypothetical protein